MARNKPVPFLHWYHHVSVLVFTWFALHAQYTPSQIFGCINALVHFFMYDYYKMRAYGVVLSYDRSITTLQITQMVCGILVTADSVFLKFTNQEGRCSSPAMAAMAAGSIVMYSSYLFLFLMFYLNRYSKPEKKASD